MRESDQHDAQAPLADEYGNVHHLADELARGGQGVVFRTRDADLAIKQPLLSGQLDRSADLRERFRHIRLLPMPARVPVSLPLAILRDEPGYVMRLLSGMNPFSTFDLGNKTKKELEERTATLPPWLAGMEDKVMALRLLHYAQTGSTRRRLLALSKCAAILARLHAAGLVYGDISTNNAFLGDEASGQVWLIDADNMRFELPHGGATAYTPGYGAPEIVRGTDSARPRTDCWAFAVMAFKMLALCHPFIGKRVLEPDGDEGGWDAEPLEDGAPADLDEQAYAGYLPYIDDEDDDSNPGPGGLPRTLVATAALRRLFQDTFGAGRRHPHQRPAMAFWAVELARAFDRSVECTQCRMSYFADDHKNCPYCRGPRPAFLRVTSPRWEILIAAGVTEAVLPHRLFHPFSFEHNDDAQCHAVPDFGARTVDPVRGTSPFPDNLTFAFVGAGE
jgi:hypothetical protein